jgi:hypothetical protein
MDTKRRRSGAAESTNFPCVARNKRSYWKALIDGWSSAICKVSTLLFALFYYYLNYLAIIHIRSKDENGIWAVFIAETSPAGRSGSSISSLVVRHDQCALSYGGSGGGRRSCSVGGLDVFQLTSTHGWTKLIAQGFNRLADISALVLPHMICNSKIQANLKQK